MPTAASRTVPKIAQAMAASTSGCGTAPTIGSSVMCVERRIRSGVKAMSVMTESIRLPPRLSMIVENRIESS